MSHLRQGNHKAISSYFSLLWVFLLGMNICIALSFLIYLPFNLDEFQHTHIAWNMFENQKVLYRDFWDHHGPLFPFINYVWFSIFNLEAQVTTFYFLRGISFLYLGVALFITYKIGHLVFKSKSIAYLSTAVLSSLHYFHVRGVEVRPDLFQDILWLAGLYIILITIQAYRHYLPLLAGVLFGLALETNAKIGIGIAAVLLFLAGEVLFGKKRRERWYAIVLILVGMLSVHAVFAIYFFSQGALLEYYKHGYLFNFILIGMDEGATVVAQSVRVLITYQLPLVIGSVAGVLILAKEIFLKYESRTALFLFVTVFCSSGIFFGLHAQFFLMFLPLLAIASGVGMIRIFNMWGHSSIRGVIFSMIVLSAFFLPMESHLMSQVQYFRTNTQLLDLQKATTNFVLENTQREESVGYFWNLCGGYVFNQDPQYYWWFDEMHGKVHQVIEGHDVYGTGFINALKQANVKYISAYPYELRWLLSGETKDYLTSNYSFISPCLLEKGS